PDLHERLAAAGLDGDAEDELVLGEVVLLRAEEEVLERQAPLAAHAREVYLALADEERRQRVARRRGGREIPADRAAVADLRAADRARRLGQRRQELRERRLHRLGVGQGR